MFVLRKIINGGQTGVDRDALDAALELGFPCGGWCPAGRKAEDGVIPDRYPLEELPADGYRQRTIKNLEHADGTVIIYFGNPEGGAEQSLLHCMRRGRPYQLIDASEAPPERAAEIALGLIAAHSIEVLNVAGPRESGWTGARSYTHLVAKALAIKALIPR